MPTYLVNIIILTDQELQYPIPSKLHSQRVIACCERVSDRLAENLKNKAIACYGRVSALAFAQRSVGKLTVGIALQKTSNIIAGGLLALFGGSFSGLGLDLAGEAANNYNHKEDKIKSIRQKCVSLQKKIEPTIFYIENIKYVAHQSFIDSRLMKFLYRKRLVKNMITAFLTGINYLLLISALIIVISCPHNRLR